MKLITLVLSVIVVKGYGFLIKVPVSQETPLTPNTNWIHRQKLILSFFNNVCDVSTDPMIIRLSNEFNLDTTENFKDPETIVTLRNHVSGKGLLPKGEIFTEYNKEHLNELQIISTVLCDAEDFDIFLKVAAWARQNINCGLFVDAIYFAVVRRRDTEKLSIPAPYELLPNYFIKKDDVITGTSLLAGIPISSSVNIRVDGNSYVIDDNYTSDIFNNDDETKLSYFHEDIGLNTHYFFRKLTKATWLNDLNIVDSRYGEFLFHVLKQLATRYDLERYANGFEDVSGIDWSNIDSLKYDPMLIYSNGNDFSIRKNTIDVTATEEMTILKNIDESIAAVVSHMRQSGFDKSMILNNLMEILVTGEKSYESLAHEILKKSTDIDGSPSALEHYMTSVRDPMFWKLNKKIVNLILTALSNFPTYTKNELYFPGVEVVNVDIKKLTTFFEAFEFDATEALRAPDSDTDFQVKISQLRLNHKSFTIKVNVSSLVTQKGLLKIYLGPKILPGELALKKDKFMLLDAFEVNLKKGSNIISRSSEQITNLSPDFTSLKNLYNNVNDAEFGLGTLPFDNIEKLISFPSRLIIPKGLEEGLPLQFFVFIAPFTKASIDEQGLTTSEFNSVVLSPGYPLDLHIENWQLFDLPNVLVKEIMVTHKDSSKGGNYDGKGDANTKWDGGENSFDYSAKKGQYGKQDYANKPHYQRLTLGINPKDKNIDTKTVEVIDKSKVNDNSFKQGDAEESGKKSNNKSDSKKEADVFQVTEDFLNKIDKKIDDAIFSFLNPEKTIRPLLKSTKTVDKYKKVTKNDDNFEKTVKTEIEKPSIYSPDVVIVDTPGQWSKTVTKSDTQTEDPEVHMTNVIIDDQDDKWSKSIIKNSTKNIFIKPVVHTDVNLDSKDGKWSKTITKNDNPMEVNKSFVHSADVVIDKNGVQESKSTKSTAPIDDYVPIIHTTVTYDSLDSGTKEKPVNKKDRPTIYDYFLHQYFDYDGPVYE